MLNPISTTSATLTDSWIVKEEAVASVQMIPGLSLVSGDIVVRSTSANFTATISAMIPTSASTILGESLDNTDGGVIYVTSVVTGATITMVAYNTTAMATADRTAAYSGVNTSAAITAIFTAENSSGLTMTLVFGSLSATGTALITIQTKLVNYMKFTTACLTATGTNLSKEFGGIVISYDNTTGESILFKRGTVRFKKLTPAATGYDDVVRSILQSNGITAV